MSIGYWPHVIQGSNDWRCLELSNQFMPQRLARSLCYEVRHREAEIPPPGFLFVLDIVPNREKVHLRCRD